MVGAVYAAFYSNIPKMLPDECLIPYQCHVLGLSYTEYVKQPLWWVDYMLILLEGKNKAEAERQKVRS